MNIELLLFITVIALLFALFALGFALGLIGGVRHIVQRSSEPSSCHVDSNSPPTPAQALAGVAVLNPKP